MVHRTSNHQTTRDQYNQKLISLSNKNLELEASFRNVQKECEKLEERATRQELQISELRRLVRSCRSDNHNVLEESSERIVDLTLQVGKLQRLLIEVSQKNLETPSQSLHHPEKISSIDEIDRDSDACLHDISTSRAPYHDSAGNSTKGKCDNCIQHHEKISNLEGELNDYRNKNEALERSVKTLKSKNTEREIRSMTSLRQMRRQIDMLEHDRKRRQDTQATLEERVAILEAEKKFHSKEMQELFGKYNKLEDEIRYTTSPNRERWDSSDHQNVSFDFQSFTSTGEKPDWVVLATPIYRESYHTGKLKVTLPSKTMGKAQENGIARIGSGSDCSDTEASTISHVGSDVCLYY